jgi:outer membrane protein assembly factor BamB
MVRRVILCSWLLACSIVLTSSARGENWPGWRGPHGDGSSHDANVATQWNGSTGENILWKVPIPGTGHASPIVWENRIFLVACLNETQERVLMCLDRTDGRLLWQRTVFRGPLETKHALNSYASSTPATDGELVYVTFLEVDGRTVPAPNVGTPRPITPGRMLVAAYDYEGNQKWLVRPGEFVSAHGYCSCPVLYKNLVIINGDHDGDSYILALDKQSGKTVWKTPREHKTRSYVTPIIRESDGRTQMVFSGSKRIVSMNPDDGSLHWYVEGPTEQFVASMVYDGKQFYMAAGFPTHHVMAIRPDGKGDVTKSHVAWEVTNAKCYVPSPVIVNGYLIVADDRGTANCFKTQTGERLWLDRLGRQFSASLVTAGGLVYCPSEDGQTIVLRPGPTLDVVAKNPLGEPCYASPAISDGQLFLRGERHLFCVAAASGRGN